MKLLRFVILAVPLHVIKNIHRLKTYVYCYMVRVNLAPELDQTSPPLNDFPVNHEPLG